MPRYVNHTLSVPVHVRSDRAAIPVTDQLVQGRMRTPVLAELAGEPFFILIRADRSVVGRFIGMTCWYDEVSVTVCAGENRFAFALDSTSNAVLWAMPEEGSRRVVPTVTAAWHGAVYGWANRAPVVLDAKTGADREPSPGLAPEVVNGRAAVGAPVQGSGNPVTVHPASG
jgi:hypothetical protein